MYEENEQLAEQNIDCAEAEGLAKDRIQHVRQPRDVWNLNEGGQVW